MEPIGLTHKDLRVNPFTQRQSCELMIILECTGCGHISKNRIAGDDFPESILSVLKESKSIDYTANKKLKHMGIPLMTEKDQELVHTALFGYK